ncbi:MAG: putative sulfate exporter family transporter [Pedobacter sp.]|uniref:YeiH family protein n=1 Tax=Pedobacter sp. TaxID=1411316 RepID=UPI003568704F
MESSKKNLIQKTAFIVTALLSLCPFITPVISLTLGILFAQLIPHPYSTASQKATQQLLKISIIALGFGMNASSVIKSGQEGILFTIASIFIVLTIGYFIGRSLKIDLKTSSLISAGTAICGGSAIAALSPVIRANEKQISIALGTVFILNALALVIFPTIGHYFRLSQSQFGLWCAISIHDTSSVVGAASKYGEQALQIATTVKLARALWIIPVSLAATYLFKTDKTKIQIPYFIGLFILAIVANTYIPFFAKSGHYTTPLAKALLSLTLFLIGSGLPIKTLKNIGLNPFLQGTVLWVIISAAGLFAVITLA